MSRLILLHNPFTNPFKISQSCSCILSFHRCSSLPRLCFYLRHYALHIISSWVTLFTAEKASFRIRLNLIQCRQTFGLPHKTQRKRMGIFSGIFGDSEKESKSEINVVNIYEDKSPYISHLSSTIYFFHQFIIEIMLWLLRFSSP